MYAKIIRVKCSHSSKPLHECEIFRKDARLLGAYVAIHQGSKFDRIIVRQMYCNNRKKVLTLRH